MPPEEIAQQKPPQLHASSRKGLLSSLREGQHDESSLDWRTTDRTLAVLIPAPLSYDSLAASGTLRWKHFFFSPVKSFHRMRQIREEASLLTPSDTNSLHEGVNLPLVGEVKWDAVRKCLKDWLRNPKNLALLLWGLAVGVSGAALFLIMVGFLDRAIESKSERDAWFEINNQILNALFTLMCLYLHPERILHLFLLYRWQPDDIKKLRQVYCKGGTYKPHEWSNVLVVVLLLNVNCFAQYALCGLNWGYKRSERPPLGVGLCLAVAMGAPAAAGIYTILSSLGKDYEEDPAHLAGREDMEMANNKKLSEKPSLKIGRGWKLSRKGSFVSRDGTFVKQPEWKGGLFDCTADPQVALFTSFCGFCVFGWNMERLGFGNRFVHIVTFILLCTAPYWIFTLAATNINNLFVRHGLSYGGIVLCIFGLLYGGFWRIQMRKTFGLPAQRWCFGQANLTDCTQWLFCSLCSLCQEVRTSEHYKIHDSKFYERKFSPEASPPSKWACPGPSALGQVSSPPAPSPVPVDGAAKSSKQALEAPQDGPDNVMEKCNMDPPIPLVLGREEAASV